MLSLHYFGDNRDLPSFPTRRSSDLVAERDQLGEVGLAGAGFGEHDQISVFQAVVEGIDDSLENANLRSEEHTSELQSHHDLVCRLLLEKKKNTRDRKVYRGRGTRYT